VKLIKTNIFALKLNKKLTNLARLLTNIASLNAPLLNHAIIFQNQLNQLKDLQRELGEMNELKESLLRELRDMEKKVKASEAEKETLSANLQQSDRARRSVSFLSHHWYNCPLTL